MVHIDRLDKKYINQYAEIVNDAYPNEDRESTEGLVKFLTKSMDERKWIEYYQVCIDEKLVGTMRFLNYQMNMRGKMIPTKGLGLVAVSPLHRKKGVAKAMMEYYIKESDKAGIDILILYPFSLKFYRKTGFGYGTKQRMYKLLPTSFPSYDTDKLDFVTKEDSAEVLKCFRKFVYKTNGMINRLDDAFDEMTDNARQRTVIYKGDSEIEGYMAYRYDKEKSDYEYDCNMIVEELVYNSPEALHAILGFIHNQKEQAIRVHLNSQDESLFFILNEPLNGEKETFKTDQLESYTTALSMMYRVTNVKRLFANYSDHSFGHETLNMKLTVKDSLYAQNDGSTFLSFKEGYVTVLDDQTESDFELIMDISDFSSLFAGAVSLKKIIKLGLAKISEEKWIDRADNLLSFPEKPQCFTGF